MITGPSEGGPPPYVEVPHGVLLQHVAGETVLLHLEGGTYYGLDEVGTRMLDLARTLDGPEAVVAQLAAEYEAEPETLARDLEALLDELEQEGLIRRAGPEGPS